MQIKLLWGMASDEHSYAPGQIIEVPDDQAARMIADGLAEEIKSARPRRETANKKAEEQATA